MKRGRTHSGRRRPLFGAALLVMLLAAVLTACEGINEPVKEGSQTPTLPPDPPGITASPADLPPTATEPPQATPVLTGDGKVKYEALLHDTRAGGFREPAGAVEAGTRVTLRLKTMPGDLTGARVRIWNNTTLTETLVPMSPAGTDTWEAVIQTPVEGAALWYRFITSDGTSTAYYTDDRDRDGGKGEGNLYEADQDFVIVAYRPDFKTPDWLKHGVVYQIFPDRFNNGDPQNDRAEGTFFYGDTTKKRQWEDAPTGGDDFFGGDLKGITARLDYIKSLGTTAIYLNPIFASPSNHRYDTTDYSQIDPALGDLAAFQELVAEAGKRGMRVLLDGVFNHASSDSIYFDKYKRYPAEGATESQQAQYFPWFNFLEWPGKYRSWNNISTLPVYQETDAVKEFLFSGPDSVAQRWTREKIGGWRLDAAEQKSGAFWRDFRKAMKAADPDGVIIGEFWHNSAPWLAGDQWDGVMNYRFRDAVLNWVGNPARTVEQMVKKLDGIRDDYPAQALAVSMNLVGTHDTARALTELGGDKNMLRLMALMQYTWPGMPTIYYGDEAGMEGGRDPDARRTYPWGKEDTTMVDYYRALAAARAEVSALRGGEYLNLAYDNIKDYYAYARTDQASLAIVTLSRNPEPQEIEVPVGDLAQDGATLEDRLKPGTTYRVQGGKVKIALASRGGALLVRK